MHFDLALRLCWCSLDSPVTKAFVRLQCKLMIIMAALKVANSPQVNLTATLLVPDQRIL